MNICTEMIRDTNFRASAVSMIESIVEGSAHVYIDKRCDRVDVSIKGPLPKVFHYYEEDFSYRMSRGLLNSTLLVKHALAAYDRWIFRNFYKN